MGVASLLKTSGIILWSLEGRSIEQLRKSFERWLDTFQVNIFGPMPGPCPYLLPTVGTAQDFLWQFVAAPCTIVEDAVVYPTAN